MPDEVFLTVMRKRIRQARLAKGLRQEDVAELTDMPLRSYQRFEARTETRLFNPRRSSACWR
jgi:transcriptional regulator with XRE-family HTH domain